MVVTGEDLVFYVSAVVLQRLDHHRRGPLDIFEVVVAPNDIERCAVAGDEVDWAGIGRIIRMVQQKLAAPFQLPDLELEYRTDWKTGFDDALRQPGSGQFI